jgi:hypothetical protein
VADDDGVRAVLDRVGRTHLHDEGDLRVRPFCGYMGVLTPADPDVEPTYPCTECRDHMERRLGARSAGTPVPRPGRTLL